MKSYSESWITNRKWTYDCSSTFQYKYHNRRARFYTSSSVPHSSIGRHTRGDVSSRSKLKSSSIEYLCQFQMRSLYHKYFISLIEDHDFGDKRAVREWDPRRGKSIIDLPSVVSKSISPKVWSRYPDRLSHVRTHLRATRIHWGKIVSLTIIAKDVRIRIVPLIWIKYFFVEDHLVIHYLSDFLRWRFGLHEDERYSIRLHMISRRGRIFVLISFSEILTKVMNWLDIHLNPDARYARQDDMQIVRRTLQIRSPRESQNFS